MQMITERISQGAAPAVLKDEPRFNLHDRFMYGNEQSCEPLRVIAGWLTRRRRLRDLSSAPAYMTSGGAMRASNKYYSPENLELLCRVLEQSFLTIVDGGEMVDDAREERIRTRLAKVIITAFDTGERDPGTLTRMAIQVVAPAYRRAPVIQ
jgi:hypothetical protein